jgi:hypothetical protein
MKALKIFQGFLAALEGFQIERSAGFRTGLLK